MQISEKQPILLWRFEDAPEELQALSNNGGDEDWLAEIPPYFYEGEEQMFLLESQDIPIYGFSASYRAPEEVPHPFKEGWKVRIGSHA